MDPFTVSDHSNVLRKVIMTTGGPNPAVRYECEDCGLIGVEVQEFERYACDPERLRS